MKKVAKRLLSFALILVLLLAVGLVPASAKGNRKFKNFVVIGDSIPAGYGLKGLIEDYPYTPENYLGLTGPEVVEGSYPQIVADAVSAKSTYKFAREAYTAVNILRLIDSDYDAKMAQPKHYYDRFCSELTYFVPQLWFPGDVASMRKTATKKIKEADLIVINLGNNDTFTLALLDPILRTLYYSFGMEIQPALTALKGQLETIDSFEELIEMAGGYDGFEDNLWKNYNKYCKNYERLMKRVRQLNPDAEIYVVGMYNLFGQGEPKGTKLQTWTENLNRKLIKKLKKLYTKDSKYKNEITYVDVFDTEVWKNYPQYTPFYYTSFLVHCHPDAKGHAYMAKQILKAINANG